jgi:hypothetical protein
MVITQGTNVKDAIMTATNGGGGGGGTTPSNNTGLLIAGVAALALLGGIGDNK